MAQVAARSVAECVRWNSHWCRSAPWCHSSLGYPTNVGIPVARIDLVLLTLAQILHQTENDSFPAAEQVQFSDRPEHYRHVLCRLNWQKSASSHAFGIHI